MISNLREVNVNQDIQPDVQDEVKKVFPNKICTKTMCEKDKSSVKRR